MDQSPLEARIISYFSTSRTLSVDSLFVLLYRRGPSFPQSFLALFNCFSILANRFLALFYTMASQQNGANGASNDFTVKAGLAQMLKGGVIMDVVNAEQVCLLKLGLAD